MTASQTVFLTEDRARAVAEGDPKARFKLVHKGQEISQAQAERYDGAVELIGGTKKAPAPTTPPEIETREPQVEHRDPQKKARHDARPT